MLPVLCGYFNKIMTSLLTKEKQKLLEYLLIKKDGAIFDGLIKHIAHHSLALILIDLLNIQIKPEPVASTRKLKGDNFKSNNLYEFENSDQENNEEDVEEGVLTPEQDKMKNILAKKGKQIIMSLLDCLSKQNQSDLEKTLNASTILLEFCENDHCFKMLTTPEAL